MIEPPIDPKIDAAAATAKGLLSAIPWVGGFLAEVGNLYLNPLERRKQRWMEEISMAVNVIKERFALIPDDLQKMSALYRSSTRQPLSP